MIEPDPDLARIWAHEFTVSSHDVIVTNSIREAIASIRDGGVDVVVLDSYDGSAGILEFVSALQKLPDSPPIVLVSSRPDGPSISARIGAATFIAKPCDAAELVREVGRIAGMMVRSVKPMDFSFDEEPTGQDLRAFE